MDFEQEAQQLMAEIMAESEQMFKQALQNKRLVFTEELKDSFERHITTTGTTIVGEISFRGYGRFKDMAKLSYLEHSPPVEAMEYFVEKTGISKFAFVPGYPGKEATSLADINRIAWAIAMSRKQKVDIKRGYRGTWYNDTKMKMINNAKKRFRWLTSEFISWQIKEQIEAGSTN